MDRQEIKENFESLRITPEQKFGFRCKQCGNCCKDIDVLLTAFDICRLAKKLGITNIDVIKKYTDVYIGRESRLPVIALKMNNPGQACVFLTEGGKCSVHDARPTVCRLYPLGRGIPESKLSEKERIDSVEFCLQPVYCGARNELHTVETWTQMSIEEHKEEFVAWQNMLRTCMTVIKDALENYSEAITNVVYELIFAGMYINYEGEDSISAQVSRNEKNIATTYEECKKASTQNT